MSPFLGDELSVNHQDFIPPLEVARATGLSIEAPHVTWDGANQTSRFGYPRDGFCFDGARYPLGWARKSASHGDLSREAREQIAVIFRGAWGAVDPITPPQPNSYLKTELGVMDPAAASLAMATEGDALEEEGHHPLDRQESGWTARPPHLVDLSGFGEGGPQRPAAVRVGGGGRLSKCGMNAQSTSSLDMLENKQDYGQRAVRAKGGDVMVQYGMM